jgi:ABC-type transport system substrate-binding protein
MERAMARTEGVGDRRHSRRHLPFTKGGFAASASIPLSAVVLWRQIGPATKGTLVDPSNLNPGEMSDVSYPKIESVYHHLARPDHQARPQLASDRSRDTSLTVQISEGAAFHAGIGLTAENAVAYARRALDEQAGGRVDGLMPVASDVSALRPRPPRRGGHRKVTAPTTSCGWALTAPPAGTGR